MGRKLSTFILAIFLSGITHCAYGRLLVFGPEFFLGKEGEYQRVAKEFYVHDVDRKFILSIQSRVGDGKGIKAAITINGARVALPDEFRGHSMIAEPVILRNKNEILVETAGATDATFLVTIINMDEEHTLTAKIPLLRETADFEGVVDFEGHAVMTFPDGSFDTSQSVTVTLVRTPSTQYLFEADNVVSRLPYEIRINSGDKPPASDVELSVRVPDSFIASDYAMHIFAMLHDNPDTNGPHDRFFQMGSGLDELVNMLKTTLPKEAFSGSYGKNGTYEAVITVGLIH